MRAGLSFGTILIVLFLMNPQSVSANVTELTVTPEHPVIGDMITIQGNASPGEIIRPAIVLKTSLEVADDDKYDLLINGIEVPTKKNTFSIKAEKVRNLSVKVSKWGLPWTKSIEAGSDGIASISQGNVPDWTFDIEIFGFAQTGIAQIPLTITAATTSDEIKADASGQFQYNYSTSKLLPGSYTINVGGLSKNIELSSGNQPSKKVASELRRTNPDSTPEPEITTPQEIKETGNEPERTPVVEKNKRTASEPVYPSREETFLHRILRILKFWE